MSVWSLGVRVEGAGRGKEACFPFLAIIVGQERFLSAECPFSFLFSYGLRVGWSDFFFELQKEDRVPQITTFISLHEKTALTRSLTCRIYNACKAKRAGSP